MSKPINIDPQWLVNPPQEGAEEEPSAGPQQFTTGLRPIKFDPSWLTQPSRPLVSEQEIGDYRFTGFGGRTPAEQRNLPQWKRVLGDAFNFAMGAFEPLLFVGDLTKAVIYGAKTGRWDVVSEQMRRAPTYAPWGLKPQPAVEASEVARALFGDKYEQLTPTQKTLVNFSLDTLLDPTAFFGVGKLATATGKVAFRNVPVVGRAFGTATEVLNTADTIAQATLNPYNILGRVLKPVAKATGEALDPLLSVKVFPKTVRLPKVAGGKELLGETGIRLWDFFGVFTPKESKMLGEAAKRYLGQADNSVSVQGLARAHGGYVIQEALRGIQLVDSVLTERLGVERPVLGLFSKKVIPEEMKPLALEVKRLAGRIADEYGVLKIGEALENMKPAIETLAKSYGVDAGALRSTVEEVAKTSTAAVNRIVAKVSNFDKYLDYLRDEFTRRGLDPDTGIANIVALRLAGGSKPLSEIAGRRAPVPARLTEDYLAEMVEATGMRMPPVLPGLRTLRINPKDWETASPDIKFYLTWALPPGEATRAADELRIPEWIDKAVSEASRSFDQWEGFIKQFISDTKTTDQAKELGRRILPHLQKGDVKGFWEAVHSVVKEQGGQGIKALLNSGLDSHQALGYVALGAALRNAYPGMSLIAFGHAAEKLFARYPEWSRYFYTMGAPVVGDVGKTLTERDITAIIGYVRGMAPEAAEKASEAIFGEWGGRLARALASKDPDRVREALEGIAKAKDVELAPQAVSYIQQYVRYAFPEGDRALARLLGYDDVKKLAVHDVRTLEEVETEALKRWWATTPNWGGLSDISDLYRTAENYTSPFTPLIVFENLRRGYMRRIYAGLEDPQAVMGAILSGRLALIPEGRTKNILQAATKHFGKDKAEAFVSELEKYVHATRLHVYGIETIAAIAKAVGIDTTKVDWTSFMADAFPDNKVALQRLSEVITGEGIKRVPGANVPGPTPLQARMELAEQLIPLWDVDAAIANLGATLAPRSYFSTFVQQVYEVLSQGDGRGNKLIRDNLDDVPYQERHLWIKVPEDAIQFRGGQALVYGPLAGKYIPRAIYRDFARAVSSDPLSMSGYAAFLSFWRKALLNSPTTLIRNVVGNWYLTWANGGPELLMESFKQLPRAVRIYNEFLETGKIPKDLAGAMYFLQANNLNREAREAVGRAVQELTKTTRRSEGLFTRLIHTIDSYANNFGYQLAKAIGKENSLTLRLLAPIEAFGYAENVQRLANYLAARAMGKNPAQALHIAANTTFDYSGVPYAIHLARNYGIMAFPSFMYFSYKAAANWAQHNPLALTLPQKLTAASWQSMSDEDHARLIAAQPNWLREKLPMAVPVRFRDGEVLFIPLAYNFPLPNSPADVINEAVSLGALGPVLNALKGLGQYLSSGDTISAPVREGFSFGAPKEVIPEGATPAKAAMGAALYLLKEYAPTYATRTLPIGDFLTLALNGFDSSKVVGELESVVGKVWIRNTNPELVRQYEQIYGRPADLTFGEAVITALLGSRRQGTDYSGVTSLQTMRGLARAEGEVREAVSRAIARGASPEEVRRMLEAFAQSETIARANAMRKVLEIIGGQDGQ